MNFGGKQKGQTSERLPIMLAAILVAALGLRLWGISFGLPYEYHVDEVQYVRQAASMGQDGLEPVWWNNPPFFKYILLAEYGALYMAGRVAGWYTSVADFGAQNTLDPSRLYILGRATSGLFGLATVAVTYLLGKSAFGRAEGLLAAWFLAVCFLHVRDSHYAVNDVPATFFITLNVWAAVKIAQTGDRKWYILAGVALGLGFATKYSALFAAVPVLVAHYLAPDVGWKNVRQLQLHRLAIVLITTILSAIIASPYFVLTPHNVIGDAYQAIYLAGQNGFDGWRIDTVSGYLFYLKTLAWGLGWGLALVSAAGLVYALIRHRPAEVVLISFVLLYYFIAGGQQSYFFARFILPIVPILLLLAAALLIYILTKVRLENHSFGIPVAAIIVLGLTILPLANIVRHNYLLQQIDTRTQAKEWIESNLPPGARIAVDWPFYGPALSTEAKRAPFSSTQYDLVVIGGHGLADNPLSWYSAQSVDYLITSTFIADLHLLDDKQNDLRQRFYQAVENNFVLVHEFTPGSDQGNTMPFVFDELYGPAVSLWERERPGPGLAVFQVQ